MLKINIKRCTMLVGALVGAAVLTGCSGMGPQPVYRVYYQDQECRIFYVDNMGQRVYMWNNNGMHRSGYKDGYKDTCTRTRTGVTTDNVGNTVYWDRMCK